MAHARTVRQVSTERGTGSDMDRAGRLDAGTQSAAGLTSPHCVRNTNRPGPRGSGLFVGGSDVCLP